MRTKVAVIFGGRSSEHEISCISARGVLAAIDHNKYEVVAIGITKDGRWVLESAHPSALAPGEFPVVNNESELVRFSPTGAIADIDVAFPLLHGPWGEDGTIQGMLELAAVPYVGSGVFASAAAMDKAHMKSLLSAAGLPIAPYQVISDLAWRTNRNQSLAKIAELGLPVFVKPARAGSSVGITKVKSANDLAAAIELARTHDPKVVIEAAIEGAREIECGVLDGAQGPWASVCAEIVVRAGHEFYDYAAKYVDDSVDLIVPAELPDAVAQRVQQTACAVFTALSAEGLARVDVFVRGDEVIVNEINTMPGFTPISMFPRMWASSGLAYPELVDYLVQDALRRGTGLR